MLSIGGRRCCARMRARHSLPVRALAYAAAFQHETGSQFSPAVFHSASAAAYVQELPAFVRSCAFRRPEAPLSNADAPRSSAAATISCDRRVRRLSRNAATMASTRQAADQTILGSGKLIINSIPPLRRPGSLRPRCV
jgi:hypothetical protein